MLHMWVDMTRNVASEHNTAPVAENFMQNSKNQVVLLRN